MFTPALFTPVEPHPGAFNSLVRFIWAGLNTPKRKHTLEERSWALVSELWSSASLVWTPSAPSNYVTDVHLFRNPSFIHRAVSILLRYAGLDLLLWMLTSLHCKQDVSCCRGAPCRFFSPGEKISTPLSSKNVYLFDLVFENPVSTHTYVIMQERQKQMNYGESFDIYFTTVHVRYVYLTNKSTLTCHIGF